MREAVSSAALFMCRDRPRLAKRGPGRGQGARRDARDPPPETARVRDMRNAGDTVKMRSPVTDQREWLLVFHANNLISPLAGS